MKKLTILNQPTACCDPSSGCCDTTLPVAIIGSGPIGLAAAAHLTAHQLPFFIVEKGELAANVQSWAHVRLFSPWQYNIDAAAKALLQQTSWVAPDPDVLPTGKALVEDYLAPLAALFSDKLYTHHEVIAITRQRMDRMKSTKRDSQVFQLFVQTPTGLKTMKASAVIDATGTWGQPNPAASHGVLLPAEQALAPRIDYHIPNIAANETTYANQAIAVIGGGHSAIQSILQLVALKERYPQTTITWVLRKKRVEDALGGGAQDELAARGELGLQMAQLIQQQTIEVVTDFMVESLYNDSEGITLKDGKKKLRGFDRLIVNTGSRPKFEMHQELRYEADAITEAVPALAGLIDPNLHSCGTVEAHGEKELRQPEPHFYIVGAKSYGRAPTFLMATGYEQVRSVVAYLAGDFEAAAAVQLTLPQTGVCNSGAGGCC